MKQLLIILSLIFIPSLAITGGSNEITITVSGIETAKGVIRIGLFKTRADFKVRKSFVKKAIPVKKTGKITAVFKNVPNGTYGVGVYHDENNNNKTDKNFVGIPKEKYGFSNNYKPLIKANFDKFKFKIKNKSKKIHVKLM